MAGVRMDNCIHGCGNIGRNTKMLVASFDWPHSHHLYTW